MGVDLRLQCHKFGLPHPAFHQQFLLLHAALPFHAVFNFLNIDLNACDHLLECLGDDAYLVLALHISDLHIKISRRHLVGRPGKPDQRVCHISCQHKYHDHIDQANERQNHRTDDLHIPQRGQEYHITAGVVFELLIVQGVNTVLNIPVDFRSLIIIDLIPLHISAPLRLHRLVYFSQIGFRLGLDIFFRDLHRIVLHLLIQALQQFSVLLIRPVIGV